MQSMEFSRSEYWSGWPFPSPGDLPNPGIKPRSPALQVDSLPAEPQGKPKNTGVGSLSLLQRIFLPQVLNRRFLHCRRFLYQLSYEGGPVLEWVAVSSCRGIFPTQGLNLHLLHCRQIVCPLSHWGSPPA